MITPRTSRHGFTVVELLIAIVIISILAALTVVTYRGIQQRAYIATIQGDLSQTAKLMTSAHAETGIYPGVLPGEVRASPNVLLTLVSTPGGYSGLSQIQNSVLFQSICQQLVNKGYGRGTNMGGGSEQYITGCHVYNNDALHINGWDSHHFTVPLAATGVYGWYNTNVTSDGWRPNKKQVYIDFAAKLSDDFIAAGGTFPVTTFWDSWATSSNGGVMKEELPAPTVNAVGDSFCVQATHAKNPSATWHVSTNGVPTAGSCNQP
jgi:prepilin-type N-terminal cleavage/methylation domain-containing protein